MGGAIAVRSTVGVGSRFTVTAPFARSATAMSAFESPIRHDAARRVLCAVDDAVLGALVCRQLAEWGADVDAWPVPEAIARVGAAAQAGRPYGLVVIDDGMPDGERILAEMRSATTVSFQVVRLAPLAAAARTPTGAGESRMKKPLRPSLLRRALGASDARPTGGAVPPPRREASRMAVHVLIVEDNPVNQLLTLTQVRRLGCTADVVDDGRRAIEAAMAGRYDVVLMDCHLPEIDGYEATRAIRSAEQGTGRHVQIIAVTANAIAGDRERCLEAGMDDYISKPVRLQQLQTALTRWVT
jgi:CheY-like chemotaxis protein